MWSGGSVSVLDSGTWVCLKLGRGRLCGVLGEETVRRRYWPDTLMWGLGLVCTGLMALFGSLIVVLIIVSFFTQFSIVLLLVGLPVTVLGTLGLWMLVGMCWEEMILS